MAIEGKTKGLVAAATLLFATGAFGLTTSQQAQARVYIADQLQFTVPIDERIDVQPGKFVRIPLPVKAPALLDVRVTLGNAVFNDLNVYVCDEDSLRRFAQRLANGCRGVNKGRGVIQFRQAIKGPGTHYLVLDNSYAMMIRKKATANVTATVSLPPDSAKQLQVAFDTAQKKISELFAVPEFNIAVRPCGQMNAFSSGQRGDITLCSELFLGLLAEGLQGALEAILFHELAHTLLNVWGLPNYDNEETADEFALVMLFWQGQQQSALDWIRYFSKHDSRMEAAYQLQHGDRHPLSVQRVRNIERILKRPRPVVQRWNRLVYPHLSEKGLRSIIDKPGHYGDRELARQELANRTQ